MKIYVCTLKKNYIYFTSFKLHLKKNRKLADTIRIKNYFLYIIACTSIKTNLNNYENIQVFHKFVYCFHFEKVHLFQI